MPAPFIDLIDMIDRAKARTTDPSTSHEAAASVNTTGLEAAVVGVLKSFGPKTINEIAEILRLSVVTVSPRIAPLRDKCIVRDSGERRIGESGKRRIAWELIP